MDFYEKLKGVKSVKKLTWTEIGAVVNKKEAAIRIAFDRKSLTQLERKELENIFVKFYDEDDYRNKLREQDPEYPVYIPEHFSKNFSIEEQIADMVVQKLKPYFDEIKETIQKKAQA
jgi:hypothetical protein